MCLTGRPFALLTVVMSLAGAIPAMADDTKLDHRKWSWQGVFGTYDHAQLRRGLHVYEALCSSCHGLSLVRYRNFLGIGLSEKAVKDYAARFEYQDGYDEVGDPKMRPGRPTDRLHAPFPNEKAARAANGGVVPPDLSLMIKARKNGPDYIYTMLTSYEDEMPEEFPLLDGLYYNPAVAGNQIAMPQVIFDGGVDFKDGSPNNKEAISKDVVAFLTWSARPELEARKSLGVRVMLFLLAMTVLLYALKRQIWKSI